MENTDITIDDIIPEADVPVTVPEPEAVTPEDLPGIEDVDPETLTAFFGDKPHTLYKVLRFDLYPYHVSRGMATFAYDPPKDDGSPGDWAPVHDDLWICNRGLHATNNPDSWGAQYGDTRIFEVEVKGPEFDLPTHEDKLVCRTMRLVREVTDEWRAAAEERRQQAEAEWRAREEQRRLEAEQAEKERIATARKQADVDGKFFIETTNAEEVVLKLLRLPCPHCGIPAGEWNFVKTWKQREIIVDTHRATLGKSYRGRGIVNEDAPHRDYEDDYDYFDDQTQFSYDCCGDDVHADDFTDIVDYVAQYTDTLDYVRDAFEVLS